MGLRRQIHREALIHKALNLRIHRIHTKTNEKAKKPAQWEKHLLSKVEDMSPNLKNPHRNWGHICNPSVEMENLGRGMQEDPRSLQASQPSQNGKLQVEGHVLYRWTSGQEKKETDFSLGRSRNFQVISTK